MEYESEVHENVELTFTYEGEDLIWRGDIEVSGHSDPGDLWTAPYADQFVEVIKTETLERYNEETDEWEAVEVTASIILEIEMAYERTL